MCGINTIIYKSEKTEDQIKRQLIEMNDLIYHRGPDDDGDMVKCTNTYAVGLAMRRLSIIDLSTGNQPFYSDNKSIALVFNGEIYNFKVLKATLIKKGVVFHTTSDTEVVLRVYETYGPEGFKQLDGMYGFSLYDSNCNKVFICRDYFGEKPIYYYATQESFYVASELKSIINTLNIKPEISIEGLNLYFRLTYIPSPFTIYKGIFKLPPNSMLTYDLETHGYEVDLINKDEKNGERDIPFDMAKEKVKELVIESVLSRSIADVPLGTFLSGGVDSSIVSLCLAQHNDNPIETFSIGFEKKSYDETDKSRIVADLIKSNHHEFIIKESDLTQHIEEIILNFDEPFADSSAIPTYIVANKTREFVKVALTGDGGDEVFGGYNKYYVGKMNNLYTKWVPKPVHGFINKISNTVLARKEDNRGMKYRLNKLIKSISYEDNYYWGIISLGLNDEDVDNFFLDAFKQDHVFSYFKAKTGIDAPKTLDDFRTIDRYISLEGDMLVKVDRTSMLNSLECRAPFLNKKLYDFTMSLPSDYLMKKWNKKYILKEAFKSDFPDGFLEKSKSGFGVPVGDWLRNSLKKELLAMTQTNYLEQQGIFNIAGVQEYVHNHINGKADNSFKVWTYYCFQKWYKHTYMQS